MQAVSPVVPRRSCAASGGRLAGHPARAPKAVVGGARRFQSGRQAGEAAEEGRPTRRHIPKTAARSLPLRR